MTHDPDLIRHILNHVAGRAGPVSAADIPVATGHSGDTIRKHIGMLIEHGLLHGTAPVVRGLTDKGHALRRALHDEGVRARIKHVGEHLGEAVTIHVILDIAKAFLLGL